MSQLFTSFKLGCLTLANRIVIPPMCQYSAMDGCATDWHLMHFSNMALSSAGLFIIEATAVTPEGRISPYDLGLWDDKTEQALAQVMKKVKAYSDMPLGIQLAHAGRKASTQAPWLGDKAIAPNEPNGWQTVAPSALPYRESDPIPRALTEQGINDVIEQFKQAAQRAERAGVEVIEIHAAHGYLLHEFLSPLSNQRQDNYGGSLENRLRLVLAVFNAVRAAVAKQMVVGIRISATDWVEGGWDLEQSIILAKHLDKLGCDYIHVSSGALSPAQQIPVGPNYQVPFAEKIKAEVAMPVIAVGLITEPEQADAIIVTQQADLVAVGRHLLYDPRWPWHAAAKLGDTVPVAKQYLYGVPYNAKGFFTQAE